MRGCFDIMRTQRKNRTHVAALGAKREAEDLCMLRIESV